MHSWSTRQYKNYPRSFPWTMIEPHRKQVESNHNQTLERLAERGGLSPTELLAAIGGMSLYEAGVFNSTDDRQDADAETIRQMIKKAESSASFAEHCDMCTEYKHCMDHCPDCRAAPHEHCYEHAREEIVWLRSERRSAEPVPGTPAQTPYLDDVISQAFALGGMDATAQGARDELSALLGRQGTAVHILKAIVDRLERGEDPGAGHVESSVREALNALTRSSP